MHYLFDYLSFLFKGLSLLALLLLGLAGILALAQKNKSKGKININALHEKYAALHLQLAKEVLPNKEFKKLLKAEKKTEKSQRQLPRCFILPFTGDLRASSVRHLREAVTSVLTLASSEDQVIVTLESPGGVVHGYGLCAAQLARIRERNIPLTVIVDKVAASGGYMMAAVANTIIAAPFALIGSIGVLAQLPNFHRFLKHHQIDFEQLSAGEFKRTLTVFGENNDKGREKMQQDLEGIHQHFKAHIHQYRPQLDLDKVATGEYWLGREALGLNLIDAISTSDEYLMTLWKTHQLFEISHESPKSLGEKISRSARLFFKEGLEMLKQTDEEQKLL